MTVLHHPGISWSTLQPEENPSFVAFVDHCFGRPAGSSLAHAFPAALAPANSAHHFVGRVGGQMVCAAAALVRDWVTDAGPVRAAAVGCFSTAPAHRGRGWSGHLQTQILARLEDEGVQWVVLWTDEPAVYAGRGFVPCGRESHGALDSVRWPAVAESMRVRRADREDAAALLTLHRTHPWRVERTLDDMRAHLDPACSEVWVATRDEELMAYAGIGKGADFAGYVADFAGEPAVVHALWGLAHQRGARAVLLPEGSDRYLEGAASGLRGNQQSAALVRRLSGPDPHRCSWAVHGFDSA